MKKDLAKVDSVIAQNSIIAKRRQLALSQKAVLGAIDKIMEYKADYFVGLRNLLRSSKEN